MNIHAGTKQKLNTGSPAVTLALNSDSRQLINANVRWLRNGSVFSDPLILYAERLRGASQWAVTFEQ